MRRRRDSEDDDYDDGPRRRRRRDDDSDGERRRRRDDYYSDDDYRRDRRRRRRRDDDYSDDDDDRRRRRRRSEDDDRGSTRLYVGNIPYSMTTEQLRDHFAACGRVVDCIVKSDSSTGRSRGFGIVQFERTADAERAIDRWNNRPYESRPLVVRYDRETGTRGAAPARSPYEGRPQPSGGPPPPDIEIRRLLIDREKARIAKDYQTADEIRSDLAERGVSVNDLNRTWHCVDGRSGERPSAYDYVEEPNNDHRASYDRHRRRRDDDDDDQDKNDD